MAERKPEFSALRKICYGLYVVCSKKDSRFNGAVVNTVIQVGSEPPAVEVCLSKTALTHDFIQASGVFTASILARETPFSFIERLGLRSGRQVDKLEDISYQIGVTGAPIVLENCLAYIEAEVIGTLDVGDHTIFVGKVVEGRVIKEGEPLTYDYYQRFLKPGRLTPRREKAMVSEAEPGRIRCSVCGSPFDVSGSPLEPGLAPVTPFEMLEDRRTCPAWFSAPEPPGSKEFDLKSLEEFSGQDGKPAYIAYQGKVFDVSGSGLWENGLHMANHRAGRDLTEAMAAAPHGPEVLESFPRVGAITKKYSPPLPRFLTRILDRFPRIKLHSHHMMVHFPIVFLISATAFTIFYLVTGVNSFEAAALICLGSGVFFTPLAIATGLLSWWLNFQSKPLKYVTLKIRFSFILLGISGGAFAWRIANPEILTSFGAASMVYLALILSLAPLVVTIGWLGAKLTFPPERD